MPFGWAGGWPSLSLPLPGLPNFTAAATSLLTSQWQRRLLLYLVRRSLTGILLLPEDDIEQSTFLTADLSQGRVELNAVRLDVESITDKIKTSLLEQGIEASVHVGSVGKVQVILGSESGDASMDDAAAGSATESKETSTSAQQPGQSITDRLVTAPIRISLSDLQATILLKPATTRSHQSTRITPVVEDLSASILHVAQDYVHEAEPDASLSESTSAEDEADPFSALPGAFSTSSRTTTPGETGSQEQVGLVAAIIQRLLARLQLQVRKVRMRIVLADVNGQTAQEFEMRIAGVTSQASGEKTDKATTNTRSLDITEPEVWVRDRSRQQPEQSNGKSVAEAKGQDSPGSEDDLALSMAIADLRESQSSIGILRRTPTSEADAVENLSSSESSEMFFSTIEAAGLSKSRSARPAKAAHSLEISTGPEELSFRFTETAWSQVFGLFDNKQSEKIACLSLNLTERPSAAVDGRISRQISIAAPDVVLRLPLNLLQGALEWTSQLHGMQTSTEAAEAPSTHAPSDVLWHATVQAVRAALSLEADSRTLYDSVNNPIGCKNVTLRLDTIQAAFRSQDGSGKAAIRKYALELNTGQSSHPMLVPEPGLAWSYDTTALQPGQAIQCASWQAQDAKQKTGASTTQKTGKTAICSTPILNDAVAVRLGSQEMIVVLQPIHLRLDLSHLQSLTPLLELSRAVSRSTSEAKQDHQVTARRISVKIGCFRISLRCPNPVSGQIRCGCTTLDIWDIEATINGSTTSQKQFSRKARFRETPMKQEVAGLGFARLQAFSGAIGDPSICFLTCEGDMSVAPGIVLRDEPNLAAQVHVPSVLVYLDKALLHRIQYLADDFGQTLSGLASQSTEGDSPVSSIVQKSDSATLSISVSVGNNQIALALPKATGDLRQIVAKAENLLIKTHLGPGSESIIDVGCHAVDIALSPQAHERVLLTRTNDRDIDRNLSLMLRSSVNPTTGGKHLCVQAHVRGVCGHITHDFDFAAELADTVKAPPGAFVDVEPGELTKIELQITDSLVNFRPMKLSSALVFSLAQACYAVALRPMKPETTSNVKLGLTEIWISDSAMQMPLSRDLLKGLGYAHLVNLEGCTVDIRQAVSAKPSMLINIKDAKARLTACPDTLLVLGAFLADFAPPNAPKRKTAQQPVPDLSGSVILQRPPGQSENQTGTSDPSGPGNGAARRVVMSDKDVQISVRGKGRLSLAPHWFADDRDRQDRSKPSLLPDLQLRLESSSATISLYEGYDFEATRKYVQKTVKATRKRLEKIRQLLAEGQMPEETVDEAADNLLQSIFLPPRPSADTSRDGTGQADTMVRILAFDDELDMEEEESGSQEWEELPGKPATMRRTFSSNSAPPTKRTSGRLHRPKQSALDAVLESVDVDFRSFDAGADMASRLKLDIYDLSIVDNLRSSTWHKFLTELRPRDGGLLRPTGGPMVQVLLRMLRTESSKSEDHDLKAKISPLRLHVDQDALDFLKAFAAFKMEESSSKGGERPLEQKKDAETESVGFVQRVEVFPIKIKLDYKPKRVDYRALQRGQTIEMMNFFHFEASEMTLRHLVLNGVPSWAKVGDMCQDIWTPDVKSHQLADFLAGINPVRSVVNVGTGVAELVLLPIQQYQRDGRLGRGVQKGTTKFAKTTALEAVKLGARLASGTQVILEKAEHMLGTRPTSTSTSSPASDLLVEATGDELENQVESGRRDALSNFSNQPKNAKEGIQSAYKSLSGNVRSAAETILAVPIEVYERSNEGPVRAVVRAVPVAVLRSGIGASQAVRETLLGLRNQMDPGAKAETQDKYKRPSAGQ